MPGICKNNRSNWELTVSEEQAPGTSRELALAREAYTALSGPER